ncbi:hypothetical protein D9M71_787680 [compost metagenome]
MGGILCGIGVARSDRFHDLFVVASQPRRAGVADDEVEMQVQQALAFSQQLLVVAGQVWVLAGPGDFHM